MHKTLYNKKGNFIFQLKTESNRVEMLIGKIPLPFILLLCIKVTDCHQLHNGLPGDTGKGFITV